MHNGQIKTNLRLIEKIKRFTKLIKSEIKVYRLVLKHEQTPFAAKALLWLAITYMLLPVDIIPDFIPILGQIDDIIIIPLLIYFALKLIPGSVIAECRAKTL